MKEFTYRAYGLQELAQLYFPASTTQSAAVQLRKWMRVPILYEKLLEAGYVPRQKILTPKQVRAIVEHLGEP